MRCVIKVAPLAQLPATASVFDYLWESEIQLQPGMVVTIPFRRSQLYGLIVAIETESLFKLKPIPEQLPITLLTALDIIFLTDLARRLNASFGSLALHMLPQLTKRTITTLSRKPETSEPCDGKLKYVWYTRDSLMMHALHKFVRERSAHGPVLVIAATHEIAQHFTEQLRANKKLNVHHLMPESAPQRRAVWLDWVHAVPNTVVVGTHLAVWLPYAPTATTIIVEPTNPLHVQWDGTAYTNRQIVEARRKIFAEDTIVITHSPDAVDLDRVSTLPQLPFWPTITDRTVEEPTLRARFLSSLVERNLEFARNMLFFVPHLRESTHMVCRDCGSLYRTEDAERMTTCVKCHNNNFAALGYGAKTLIRELEMVHLIGPTDQIDLLDADEFKKISFLPPVKDVDKKYVTIVTAPLYDRLNYDQYDAIVDLSVDFDMLHPEFNTEELAWNRLRALSARLPAGWQGAWYVQTRQPDLRAWKLGSGAGFEAWWAHERPLRLRFKQPPFSDLDFYANS